MVPIIWITCAEVLHLSGVENSVTEGRWHSLSEKMFLVLTR